MIRNALNRTLHMASNMYAGYAEPCAFENVYKCNKPGAVAETLLAFAAYYSAKLILHTYPESGVGAKGETNTIFKALQNGTVDAAGPNFWYLEDRVKNLPKITFPIGNNWNL